MIPIMVLCLYDNHDNVDIDDDDIHDDVDFGILSMIMHSSGNAI